MNPLDKLPKHMREWAGNLLVYDRIAPVDNPSRAVLAGIEYICVALCTAMVAVRATPEETNDLPEAKWVARVWERMNLSIIHQATHPMRALRLWAGAPIQTGAQFGPNGEGPYFVPRSRPCWIFGVPADANLIAHVLAGLEGDVRVEVRGPTHPLFFWASNGFAVVMPLKDNHPTRMDADGLHGGYGREDEDDEDDADQ